MRPVAVTLVAVLYLAVGLLGIAAHFHSLLAHQPDAWTIEITEALALVAGVFLLLRHNWARWLAVAWIAFHVILTLHQPLHLAVHCIFLLLIAWALFHRAPRAGSAPPQANKPRNFSLVLQSCWRWQLQICFRA